MTHDSIILHQNDHYLRRLFWREKNHYTRLIQSVIRALKSEIAEKRLHLKKKEVLIHQNNVPNHKSMKSMAKLHEFGFELLPHLSYSPDLAPGEFFSLETNLAPLKRYSLQLILWSISPFSIDFLVIKLISNCKQHQAPLSSLSLSSL